ncbi:SgcJ/EcaC family oxidoreductase [Mesorhizobium sp. B2-5-13]|uniref:YybH family protein n=1 Tax=unclassified Mesorhizobium TaxID=325217 RepID=UPI00112E5769|nr:MULTISPECIES: SgcJ/EcaC family oxidoreductase [unclassified Mesorhizobium]TPJ44789.1 SgcJ/EcaC family oxidoreductase [Mesorhizobium sp. B2-6-5]TPJ91841.1 SgcJ/EcaC family oxidoreductase [Mesorhizobium sp. B2-5-13]TPK53169.1 SgcJ/EcaC family oxidoreductase [Mesorhizobium sp. B2-5-5]
MTFKYCMLVVAITALSLEPANAQSAKDGIEASNAKFMKSINSKDAAGVASLYTEDASALPPDMKRVDGRENIQKIWQGAIEYGVSDLKLTTVEVQEVGDFAFETSAFSYKMPGKDSKPVDGVGKAMVVWKKAPDGKWQIYRDIWNSDPAK